MSNGYEFIFYDSVGNRLLRNWM